MNNPVGMFFSDWSLLSWILTKEVKPKKILFPAFCAQEQLSTLIKVWLMLLRVVISWPAQLRRFTFCGSFGVRMLDSFVGCLLCCWTFPHLCTMCHSVMKYLSCLRCGLQCPISKVHYATWKQTRSGYKPYCVADGECPLRNRQAFLSWVRHCQS